MKAALSRRMAFLIRSSFVLINHTITLSIWLLFFSAVPIINGWNKYHLMLAYGMCWFAWGFVSFFAYGFRMLPRTIEFGDLDHYLLQPRPILFLLAASNGEVFGLPDMVLAALLFIYAAIELHVMWGVLIFALACSVTFFTACNLIIGSLGFWLRDMQDFLNEAQFNFYLFAARPVAAYRNWVKILMFTVLPVGFISFIPVEILRLNDFRMMLIELIATVSVVLIAGFIFKRGLRKYESGNRFGVRV